ncbi:MAG: lipoate--protein ligase family protein, partial [Clostridiales bacterium]|nr:lipoate--protein ligase family protein [Clostridiales bacterium]
METMWYAAPDSLDAAFYFAAEEYLTTRFSKEGRVLLLWRTEPGVMLGVNQAAEAEVDLAEAERLGVSLTRRSSGGGAIFTDPGTLLFTVILPFRIGEDDAKRLEREYVAGPIVRVLNQMGVPARCEGRNDITVDGKKVSGLAQYARGGRLCTHGSLLYDADLDTLARVLRPDAQKTASKSVRSVRARVANL